MVSERDTLNYKLQKNGFQLFVIATRDKSYTKRDKIMKVKQMTRTAIATFKISRTN